MIFNVQITDKTAFTLTPEEGSRIRELITQQIDVSFREYIHRKTGMEDSNVSAMLNGKRNLTIGMLRKLISGTRMEIEDCTLTFTLENTSGGIVQTAVLPTLEEMLFLQEQNGSGESTDQQFQMILKKSPSMQEMAQKTSDSETLFETTISEDQSSSLEKRQGKLKTLLASRSWETKEESSDSSSTD